ncbi:MAG TPA: DUF1573 domain-containing protein [Cyclobacteriaceae bacterium]
MKITFVYLVLICFGGVVQAQQAEPLLFREKTHDFGEVLESGGSVDYEFTFTNNAGRTIKILSVQASCGCTTPDWSRESIAVGKSGFIKVSFDPRGKPGYFNKSLTVTTDLDGNSITLLIKGQVVAASKIAEDLYPVENGNLRLKNNSFNLGKIFINREPAVSEYEIYNASGKTIHFSKSTVNPPYITVTVPDSLSPKTKGKVRVSYNAKLKNQYGFVSDNIELLTDDDEIPRKPIAVYATIEEYFPTLSADELSKSPGLVMEFSSMEMGRTKPGNSLTGNVRLKNSGKKELVLHTLQPNCSCLTVQSEKMKMKPGEETVMKITLNPQGRTGTLQKAITIYSNDPKNPVQRITLTAYIEE